MNFNYKSGLINALEGSNLLPTDVLPTTAVVSFGLFLAAAVFCFVLKGERESYRSLYRASSYNLNQRFNCYFLQLQII